MQLNRVLGEMGVQSIETDLGEYILQINDNEPPSHIIAPVVHKDKEQIADLFARTHNKPRLTDIPDMTREAREVLRPHFMSADMGVTGGNFLIAETGSVAVVTNEGNEGMCTVMPRVHVAVTGIEKVLPTLEDLATAMRLLPRSATGQTIVELFFAADRPARRRRNRRARAHVLRARRWRAHRAHRRRVSGDAALYPLRRVHESLSGVSEDRRTCVRLGVSRSDGLGADTGLCRHRQGARSAAGRDALRRVQQRVSGRIPCRICCASCAKSRWSDGCVRGANARRLRCGAISRSGRPPTRLTKLAVRGSNAWAAAASRFRVCRSVAAGRARATCPRPLAGRSASCTRRSDRISADSLRVARRKTAPERAFRRRSAPLENVAA